MKVYERVKQLRDEKDLTQNELAQLLGMNRSVYNKIETNVRPIRENELTAIADFFSVSTDYLLGRTTQKYDTSSIQKDIGKQLEAIIEQAETETNINFYGKPMTTKEREFLASVLEISLRLSKEKFKDND